MSGIGRKGKPQSVNVYLRIRPPNKQERDAHSLTCVEIPNSKEVVIKQQHGKKYCFEKVFGPNSKQVDVYLSVVKPLIPEVLAGYNCTVFAYGQTGAGKTYTMAGGSVNSPSASWHSDEEAGIIPRALAHLFEELRLQQQQEYTVRVSYLELYNEDIFDLLSDGEDNSRIRIYEDQRQKGSVIVQGIEEVTVCNKNEVYKILEKGQEKRRTAATLMNAQSSRSHTVFCITVYARETTLEEEVVKMGKLNLVDLAGSENISRSGAVDVRAREAGSINQSLLTLGRCIKALVDRCPHVPYRESKLTRILQDSLGGRTKTSIIATISPTFSNLEETLSTLDYAYRARNITNRPEINQRLSKRALLSQYTEEIERLRKDLNAAHSKTGIFIAHENYERLMTTSEYQKEELAEKIVIIRDLQDRIQLVEQQKAIKEKEWEDLSASFKIAQDYLAQYASTEKVLKEQAETLLDVVEKSTSNESKLHEKVDYFYDVTQKNKGNTNKIITLLDENLCHITEQMQKFYRKYDSQNRALLEIIRNSEQLLETTMFSLNLVEEQNNNLDDNIIQLQEELDKETNDFYMDINKTVRTSNDKIQKFKLSFGELMQNHLNNVAIMESRINEQQNEFKDFTQNLTKHIENARRRLIVPAESLIQQTCMLKSQLFEVMDDIKNGMEMEKQLQDMKLANMNKVSKHFEKITPLICTLDSDVQQQSKNLNVAISEMHNIICKEQPNITAQFEGNISNVKNVAATSHTIKDSVNGVLQNLEDKNANEAAHLQEKTVFLKDNYTEKVEDLLVLLNNIKLNEFDIKESLTNVDINTGRTLSGLNEMTEIISEETETNKEHFKTCTENVKKVLTEELITVEPTGATPVRTQFQYPKKLVSTSLKEHMVQKFEDYQTNKSSKLPLMEHNRANNVKLETSNSIVKYNDSNNKFVFEDKENFEKNEL
ncbi:kinesin-like protein Klp61F [Agrilus planipennis]|uniref:Kinesin-like protein n=1 Tax=Agrilus planipennis TaxID=224129 RepID=A0A1W4XP42_AGRPL|nr:kinesin-like protein Klp61F [Agrilus planipennis]